jgi:glutamate synthase (NADPH/NADH) small chain
MTEAPGNDFRVEAELVLLAMGFTGTGNTRLTEALGLALDERGFPRRDGQNMTSVRGVFVAGDMAQGASLVVRAIADGRRTAEGIVRYFEEMPGSHTIEGGPARAA